ncbi:alpha/beta fold hydrolase [Rothia nasimurium]|uniref:alpha/beta fold hydrolase n=1 Tax=Rothia nasimurium TaxID=85336 RepID=UPI003B9FD7A9
MSSLSLTVEFLPAPDVGQDAPARLLEGQQVVLVHGLAATAAVTWEQTRWVRDLHRAGAHLHLVTLPLHDFTPVGPGRVTRLPVASQLTRGIGLVPAIADSLAEYLQEVGHPVHLLGYSLGAHLVWQLTANSPRSVLSLTVGGMPLTLHTTDIHQALANHQEDLLPPDLAAVLTHSSMSRQALLDFTSYRLYPPTGLQDLPSPLPGHPVLAFAGTKDRIAADLSDLAALLPAGQTQLLGLEGRTHISCLTSGSLRSRTIDFLAASTGRKS